MEESEIVKEKTLNIEKLIVGTWLSDNTDDIWQFSSIAEEDRIGNLLIIGNGNPTPGRFMQYEIIWVNDNLIFIDLIWLSIIFRTQHQIWVTEKYLKIDLSKYQQPPKQQYLLLYKG